MAEYISRKTSWLRCLISFIPAAGLSVLLCILLAEPRLGPFYDFLLHKRPAAPVSRELLIIDSSVSGQELGDDILEPGVVTSLLYTMTELGGRALIIQVPVLGLSAGGSAGEAEILYRFDEEFSILSSNIRNLFDAIRTGSVAPAESARYVGELVDLSDKGKERLVSALVHREEEGIVSMEKAAAFFGHVRRPGDLRVQLIRTSAPRIDANGQSVSGVLTERDEYSRSRPDRDGILRRVAPVLAVPFFSEGNAGERTQEHIIYGALKTRFKTTGIEYTDSSGFKPGRVLAARGGPDGRDRIIPLDRNGAVLFEIPRREDDFRRISISEFLAYDEADRNLRRLLLDAEALGVYQYIEGENHPGFLYDYALLLREEFAALAAVTSRDENEERKLAWIEARNRYFSSLEEFLYGPSEMNLVRGYEEIIASESWETSNLGEEAGIARIVEMRDSLIRTFIELRFKCNEVLEYRRKLESAVALSFCILGRSSMEPNAIEQKAAGSFAAAAPLSRGTGADQGIVRGAVQGVTRFIKDSIRSAFFWTNPTDTEASALLANSILTGRVVKPGGDVYLLLSALLCALLVCILIRSYNPVYTLIASVLLILLAGIGFSLSFILSGIWLDPLVPVAAASAGALISFTWALIARARYGRQFRLAFGPNISHSCLRSVIHAGRPLPHQALTVRTAVVAVKKAGPAFAINTTDTRASAQAILAFLEKASELFKKAGGTVIGTEGDIVMISFGSPLERVFLGGKRKVSPYEDNIHAKSAPALRAVDIIYEIVKRSDCASWQFGLDLGDCTFAWTAVSGYLALGSPVQKAKLLSRLAGRHKARIVISNSVNEALPDLAVKKLDVLKGADGVGEEPYYRLAIIE